MISQLDRPRPRRAATLRRSLAVLLFASVPALAACKTKKAPTTVTTAPAPAKPRPPAAKPPAQPQTATVTPEGPASEAMPSFAPIRFDFDSTDLSPEARDELQSLAGWMSRNTAVRVTIEGHADERGTTEYNLALGQQRADVIARFLARLGIDAGRLQTISYGEERPAAEGDSEEAWAANRRGELQPRR